MIARAYIPKYDNLNFRRPDFAIMFRQRLADHGFSAWTESDGTGVWNGQREDVYVFTIATSPDDTTGLKKLQRASQAWLDNDAPDQFEIGLTFQPGGYAGIDRNSLIG